MSRVCDLPLTLNVKLMEFPLSERIGGRVDFIKTRAGRSRRNGPVGLEAMNNIRICDPAPRAHSSLDIRWLPILRVIADDYFSLYSYRNAEIGFVAVARRAGTQHAIAAVRLTMTAATQM